jgi:hypothetical protein
MIKAILKATIVLARACSALARINLTDGLVGHHLFDVDGLFRPNLAGAFPSELDQAFDRHTTTPTLRFLKF